MAELTAEAVRQVVREELRVVHVGFGAVGEELGAVREEFRTMGRQLREEFRGGIEGLREELRGDMEELRGEFRSSIEGLRSELGGLRSELRGEIIEATNRLRDETMEGFERVLDTMQALHDDRGDDLAGFDGRLRKHNERIARLERHNNLR